MKKQTYKAAPKALSDAIMDSERIDDFLPEPEKLMKKKEETKITLSLTKESVQFIKTRASKIGVPYQSMIKTIIDRYADYYGQTTKK